MTRKIATVSEGDLYGVQTQWQNIRVDSPQWFAWLAVPEHDFLPMPCSIPPKATSTAL